MMSDNAIIKALEWIIVNFPKQETPKDDSDGLCNRINLYCQNAVSLIKLLKLEKEALIAGQETLQKAFVEKNAEIERKDKILNSYALQYGTVTDQSKKVKEIKSEAYKEFAEEYEKRCIASGVYPAVTKNILKNLLKELTEGSNETVD